MTVRTVLAGFGLMAVTPVVGILWPACQPVSIVAAVVGVAVVAGGGADGTLPRQI